MALEKGDIIQATIERVEPYFIFLKYKSQIGLIHLEDSAWIIDPERNDFIEGNIIQVEIRRPAGRFLAIHRPSESSPPSKAIGYWQEIVWINEDNFQPDPMSQFPHPDKLVKPSWQQENKEKIINYLNNGWTHTHWRGVSFCRFDCGISNGKMGSKCLTDGEWSWPEGLTHYIETHNVQLPEDFISTMENCDWDARNRYTKSGPIPRGKLDFTYWIDWSAKFT